MESGFADVLVFRPAEDAAGAFSFIQFNPPPRIRSIRILLPDYQEFVLLSRQAGAVSPRVVGDQEVVPGASIVRAVSRCSGVI